MKKRRGWKGALIRNRVVVILLILIQAAILVYTVLNTTALSEILRDVCRLLSFLVALHIISKPGEATSKLSWVFVVLLAPVFGGVLYVFYTKQYGTKWLRGVLAYSEAVYRPQFFPDVSVLPLLEQREHEELPLMRYLEGNCGFPVYGRSACTFYSPGEDYFQTLLNELRKAEKYIFIETFIIEEGVMWGAVLDILEQKAAQGVDVRVLYDDVGCFLTLPKDYRKTLESKGIRAQVFNPLRPMLAVIQNQRDHRKVTSIDGKVAFTGGCNYADEYINLKEKHGYWKDAMVCVRGEAAWSLTLIGMQLWDLHVTAEEIEALCPWNALPDDIPPDGYIQPYADNPLGRERVGRNIYLHILHTARDYVYIQSPYLVIDDLMLAALTRAAQSGVDVRLVIPSIPDHPMVLRTAHSYLPELVAAGVKVYEYTPGFIHSKVFVSDDSIATVGTSNLDYRSLYQHFECGTVLYDCAAITNIKADFLQTMDVCRRFTEADLRVGLLQRIFQEILRLFAPLM